MGGSITFAGLATSDDICCGVMFLSNAAHLSRIWCCCAILLMADKGKEQQLCDSQDKCSILASTCARLLGVSPETLNVAVLADKPVQGHFGAADAGRLPASRRFVVVRNVQKSPVVCPSKANTPKDPTTAHLLEERLRAAGNPDATIFVYDAWQQTESCWPLSQQQGADVLIWLQSWPGCSSQEDLGHSFMILGCLCEYRPGP